MVTVLPSPLLPAESYADLLDGLRRAGIPASLADARLMAGEGPEDLLHRWSAAAEPGGVLLAHSNAGFLAPLVRHRLSTRGAPRTPIVFMDAALPAEQGGFALAPAAFRAHLEALADAQGMLPPWTRWWPRPALAAVIPEERFAALDASCPRLPLSYFDTRYEAPAGWAREPNAYLAFGATYAEELAFARHHGWPSAGLDAGHLAWLADPDGVAAAVVDLASRMDPGIMEEHAG